jgi:Rps23 Pro-64 3,4-dihydroxylase Tpa1-like proline 4-hydroxylase
MEWAADTSMGALSSLADVYRRDYQAASPWPHLVMEGLFPPDLLAAAESEAMQQVPDLPTLRTARQVKSESPKPSGPAVTNILNSLCGDHFVGFLGDLTGIEGLIADRTHVWAGLHVFPSGGFQALHRDFRMNPQTGHFHRVNVITYLNTTWNSEYGGELEFWATDKSSCVRRIAPLAGQTVIFETAATAYHGVPDPIRCPPNMARISLAVDYFTVDPGPNNPKGTYFRRPKRPQDPWYIGLSFADTRVARILADLRHRP